MMIQEAIALRDQLTVPVEVCHCVRCLMAGSAAGSQGPDVDDAVAILGLAAIAQNHRADLDGQVSQKRFEITVDVIH